MQIFTNSSSRFIVSHFEGVENSKLKFAVPFFTAHKKLLEMLENGCQIKLIVRLGYPTSPQSLAALFNKKYQHLIQIRFFTSHHFHSKLYLFDEDKALVGSANLTDSALFSNQEIILELDQNNAAEVFELSELFDAYWEQAAPLDEKQLSIYEKIYYALPALEMSKDVESIEKALGKVEFNNIKRDEIKRDKKQKLNEEFAKKYQLTVGVFNQMLNLYTFSYKPLYLDKLPARLEFDEFFHFVRSHYATGDSWKHRNQNHAFYEPELKMILDEWRQNVVQTENAHGEHLYLRAHEVYPKFQAFLGSPDIIQAVEIKQLLQFLVLGVNSMGARIRYYKNVESFVAKLLIDNDEEHIKSGLIYLLYGQDEVKYRMVELIEGNRRIIGFGRSAITEILGWLNQDELPIINEKITKVMSYFGYDVEQYAE